jgi:ABC-type microcin C transport system permease subunit YejE
MAVIAVIVGAVFGTAQGAINLMGLTANFYFGVLLWFGGAIALLFLVLRWRYTVAPRIMLAIVIVVFYTWVAWQGYKNTFRAILQVEVAPSLGASELSDTVALKLWVQVRNVGDAPTLVL